MGKISGHFIKMAEEVCGRSSGSRRYKETPWTDKIEKAVVLERAGEGKIMLELIKER